MRYLGYEISEDGDVFSSFGRKLTAQILQYKNMDRTCYIKRDRLVYEAFFKKLGKNEIVMHSDGNPDNCAISNLYLMSLSEYRLANQYPMERKKFSPEECEKILREYNDDPQEEMSYRKLAGKYNCGLSTIIKILNGTYYKKEV